MKNVQGFTMIELLIVIAIIGILAVMLLPNMLGSQKRTYDVGAMNCGRSVQVALGVAHIDTKIYPTTISKTALTNLANACKPTTVTLTGTGTQNNYSFTVADTRGAKTYTFTAGSMTKN